MFVLVTLLVVVLGWFFTGPEKQRRIIAELRARQVDVEFGNNNPAEPYNGWLPEAYFKQVESATLCQRKGVAEDVAWSLSLTPWRSSGPLTLTSKTKTLSTFPTSLLCDSFESTVLPSLVKAYELFNLSRACRYFG
jgi:hypothetical protein